MKSKQTLTGRMSDTRPNLQSLPINSPEAARIKAAVWPPRRSKSELFADLYGASPDRVKLILRGTSSNGRRSSALYWFDEDEDEDEDEARKTKYRTEQIDEAVKRVMLEEENKPIAYHLYLAPTIIGR